MNRTWLFYIEFIYSLELQKDIWYTWVVGITGLIASNIVRFYKVYYK